MTTKFDALEYLANTAEPEPMRDLNTELLAALERIAAGETMLGKLDYTNAELVVKYQEIARAAIAKAKSS